MYDKSTSLSRVYQACYPLAVSSYTHEDDHEDELARREDVLEDLEQERLSCLLVALRNTVFKQVLKRIEKIAEIDQVLIHQQDTLKILQEIVYLGEREPYGIRGGTLVVLFSDCSGTVHKIGRFPLDAGTVPTYQLHLTLRENKNFKIRMENLVRRVSGQGPVALLSPAYTLTKKKLYRSSSSSLGSQ